EEFNVSRIKTAVHIGYDQFDINLVKDYDKNTPIIVYCSIGYRSEQIAEKLVKAGFVEVYNLQGGIFNWINQGYPVENNEGVTQNIHPYNKWWGKWILNGEKTYGR